MRYHNITKDDMLNGDGIRVVLWVAGCEHHCPKCQNPETWDINGGIPFDEEAKEELFAELSKDYINGITFSGGDPLHTQNRGTITELAKEIKDKFPQKTIWCYTGYLVSDVMELEIFQYLDVLVDGTYNHALRDTSLHWIGSANQAVIPIKHMREQSHIILKILPTWTPKEEPESFRKTHSTIFCINRNVLKQLLTELEKAEGNTWEEKIYNLAKNRKQILWEAISE